MDYKKKYKEALERARAYHKIDEDNTIKLYAKGTMEYLFPELKEAEDEKIRKALVHLINEQDGFLTEINGISVKDILSWLEKQGDTNETIDRDEFAQGVLRGAAINLITWIDYNAAEGNACLSNMECKDIEDALVSGDWNKIYAYMKKKLEKQGQAFAKKDVDDVYIKGVCDAINELEKQDKSKFEQCVQEGDKIVTNKDGTRFNVNQLERVAKKEPKFPSLSEKEIVCLKRILDFLREEHNSYTGKDFTNEIAVLEWFITHPVLRVAKVAWSEDDENKVTLFMQLTEGCDNEEELVDWLKSLKERIKPKWKPSEEQMDNLSRAFNGATYQVSLLRKLYQDLKKLMEE